MQISSALEKFRDLELSKEELFQLLPRDREKAASVIIASKHVINLLSKYKLGKINKEFLLNWVNVVWFSELFDYADNECDSIASVMNELEELDEPNHVLDDKKIDQYIAALKSNNERLLEWKW